MPASFSNAFSASSMPVAYSIASGSGTLPAGNLSSRSTSDAASFISAPLPISAAMRCTAASVCFSLGRFSARPEVNLSHASLAPDRCVARLAQQRLEAHEVGVHHFGRRDQFAPAGTPRWTSCTEGTTGALIAT